LLALEGAAVGLRAPLVGLERLRQRCLDVLGPLDVAERLEREQRSPAARALLDRRQRDRAAEGVGHDLRPRVRVHEAAARAHHSAVPGQRLGQVEVDQPEAQGHRLEAPAQQVQRLGARGEPGDRRAGGVAPARAALAREQRQHRQPVGVGLHRGDRALGLARLGQAGQPAEPGDDAAPVGERAADHHAPRVRPVAPQALRQLGRLVRPPQHAQGAARADHQRRAVRPAAAAAEVGASAVPPGREPRRLAQRGPALGPLGLEAAARAVVDPRQVVLETLGQLRGPAAFALVEQAGSRRHRDAGRGVPEQAAVHVLAG